MVVVSIVDKAYASELKRQLDLAHKRSSIDFKCIKGLGLAKTWEEKDKVVKQWRRELSSLDQATTYFEQNADQK